jgi:hypothetical protein
MKKERGRQDEMELEGVGQKEAESKGGCKEKEMREEEIGKKRA